MKRLWNDFMDKFGKKVLSKISYVSLYGFSLIALIIYFIRKTLIKKFVNDKNKRWHALWKSDKRLADTLIVIMRVFSFGTMSKNEATERVYWILYKNVFVPEK